MVEPLRLRLMRIVGLVGRLAEPINLADAQKHPSFKYIPSVKRSVFRAFLGVPIIQRRQLLGVLVVQQRELRQYDESEESFLVTLATQMAAILSQSQVTALFGQYRQTRIRALPAAPGVAIATGWQDATMPLMEQVYEASTLDTSLERERLTSALEEAANEFRRYSKRFAAGAQKRRRPFSICTHTCFQTPDCVANSSPRSTKALLRSGPLKNHRKICRAICGANR